MVVLGDDQVILLDQYDSERCEDVARTVEQYWVESLK